MDWANVTKVHTPHLQSAICPSPPDKHVLKKEKFATGNTKLSKIIADIKTAVQGRCSLDYCSIVVRSSMLLGAMAIFSDTLFSELYVI